MKEDYETDVYPRMHSGWGVYGDYTNRLTQSNKITTLVFPEGPIVYSGWVILYQTASVRENKLTDGGGSHTDPIVTTLSNLRLPLWYSQWFICFSGVSCRQHIPHTSPVLFDPSHHLPECLPVTSLPYTYSVLLTFVFSYISSGLTVIYTPRREPSVAPCCRTYLRVAIGWREGKPSKWSITSLPSSPMDYVFVYYM